MTKIGFSLPMHFYNMLYQIKKIQFSITSNDKG
jgi:hypothetical protein